MNGTVIFIFNSPTAAFKAQKLLLAADVQSTLSKKTSQNGCVYAIAVPQANGGKAHLIFEKHGISFKGDA